MPLKSIWLRRQKGAISGHMVRYVQKLLILFLGMALFGLPSAYAQPLLTLRTQGGQQEVSLQLPIVNAPHIFTVDHPDRLVVDVHNITRAQLAGLTLPANYQGGIVKTMRIGQFDAKTVRIVFELTTAPASLETTSTPHKESMQVNIILRTKEVAQKPVGLKSVRNTTEDTRPLVVIDAGHGGQDPGTTGPDGVQEKAVVLSYAQALKAALVETGRYRALLTREDDHFILLRQRVVMARGAHGNLFISLHADSAPSDDASGLSVYTLSEQASDKESAALAERENHADAVYDLDLSDQSKDVADILVSLAQRDTNSRSASLAEALVSSLQQAQVNLLSTNPHRFAGFAVLKAPDIASVLVEIGFLSNGTEQKRLQSKAYRAKVVAGLVEGVDRFFTTRQETSRKEP